MTEHKNPEHCPECGFPRFLHDGGVMCNEHKENSFIDSIKSVIDHVAESVNHRSARVVEALSKLIGSASGALDQANGQSTPAASLADLSAALKEDVEYAWSWHCAAAMCAVDEGMGHAAANRAAARFMQMAFGVDMTSFKHYLDTQQPVDAAIDGDAFEMMNDALAGALGSDAYYCTRVWAAWGVGTMSEDDFSPIVEDENRMAELCGAAFGVILKSLPDAFREDAEYRNANAIGRIEWIKARLDGINDHLNERADQESAIRSAISSYHGALDRRENGSLAADKLVHRIEAIMAMPWVQGATLQGARA